MEQAIAVLRADSIQAFVDGNGTLQILLLGEDRVPFAVFFLDHGDAIGWLESCLAQLKTAVITAEPLAPELRRKML